jgi:hypothetical protein
MLVRKKAKACGGVLYGIVLGLVLALQGCNNTACSAAEVRNGCWPAIGSKVEQELQVKGLAGQSGGAGGQGP